MVLPENIRDFVYEANTMHGWEIVENSADSWITAQHGPYGDVIGHDEVLHVSDDETIRRIKAKRTEQERE